MTKTEMVDLLNKEGKGTKAALKKMGVDELTEMVSGLEKSEPVADEPVVEETVEVADESVEDKPTKEPTELLEIVGEYVHQLGIFTEFIYHVKNQGAEVTVINEGYGDAYVSDKQVTVGVMEDRIVTGEQKVFDDVKTLYMIAASQPTIRIIEKK